MSDTDVPAELSIHFENFDSPDVTNKNFETPVLPIPEQGQTRKSSSIGYWNMMTRK